MVRRMLLLALPLVLVLPACSDDDSPDGNGDGTTTTGVTTSSSSTSSSVVGSSTSSTSPSSEIPLEGPAGTSGTLRYTLAAERSELCYRITISGAGPASAAHVHRATGDTVLTLTPPAADGGVDTCTATDALLIEELQADPGQFYIDVHAETGVLRGDLG